MSRALDLDPQEHAESFRGFAFDEETDWRSIPDMAATNLMELRAEQGALALDPQNVESQIALLESLEGQLEVTLAWTTSRLGWLRDTR